MCTSFGRNGCCWRDVPVVSLLLDLVVLVERTSTVRGYMTVDTIQHCNTDFSNQEMHHILPPTKHVAASFPLTSMFILFYENTWFGFHFMYFSNIWKNIILHTASPFPSA